MASNEAGPLDWMRAVRDADAPALHKAIAWALILRANNEDARAWPDYETLAHDIGTSRATVARAVPELIRSGRVGPVVVTMTRQRNGKRWGPTVYQLALSTSQDEHRSMSISPSDAHHERIKSDAMSVSNPGPSGSQDETVSAKGTAKRTAQEIEGAADAGPTPPPGPGFGLTPPEPEAPKGRKKSSKPRGAKSRCECPADFTPNATNYKMGEELGFDRARVDAMVGEMRDYHASEGNLKADWHATLNTWLRNAVRFAKTPIRSARSHQPPQAPANGKSRWQGLSAESEAV